MKYVKLSEEKRQAIIYMRLGFANSGSQKRIFMGYTAIARILKVCFS